MDFHELEAFVQLAKTLHFGRAATSVHSSPSALSRLVSRLEEELGTRLFERDTRRVALTSQGNSLLDFAEETLRRRDELHMVLNADDKRLRGTLRIYASVTACYSILPPLIEALRTLYPELRLSVETGDPAGAERIVRDGGVDIALAALPEAGFVGLDCFSVQRTPLVFVANKDGAWGRLQHLEQHLETIPLILPREGLARKRFDKWMSRTGVRPHISAETAGNEAILAFTRLGMGLGLVPRLVLDNSPFADGLVLYETGGEFGDYDIGFVLARTTVSGHSIVGALKDLLVRVYTKGHWVGDGNGKKD